MTQDNRRNLRSDIWRESVSEEVTEELSFHIEMRAREMEARGVPLEEARRRAAARFGDLRHVQAECEHIGGRREADMKRNTFWSELRQDVHFALRQMRAAPGFSALVIGTLALGIGASTTIFSAVNAVVLRPLDFPHEDRVVLMREGWEGRASDVSPGSYMDWKAQGTLFSAMAAVDWDNYVITNGDLPDRVLGSAVTSDYFRVFSTQPMLGRTFTSEDEAPGAPRVLVLSHASFASRFNSAPNIVGSDVRLNGEPARIIGVMPEKFDPLQAGEALWVPLSITAEQIANRGSHYLHVVALKKSGVTDANLGQQLARIHDGEEALYPDEYGNRSIMTIPMREAVLGDVGGRLYLLLGAVLVVLLIACANIANLLLARGASRQKELAVRGALGAGRARILRQLLTENLVVSFVTVLVSVAVAFAGSRMIVRFAPGDIPRITETRVDATVLLFALMIGVFSSILFGLAPALRAMRADLQSSLRSGGRDANGVIRDWLRSTLVTAEVAMSVLLLVGAGLLIRTSVNAGRVKTGFRVEGVLAARVTLPAQTYADPQRALGAFTSMIDATSAEPGVTKVAASSLPPVTSGGNEMFLNPSERPQTRENASIARLRIISPHYFDVLDIPLLQGRAFNERDVRSSEHVTIISADLAKQMYPNESAIGKRFACCEGDAEHPAFRTIVGVTPPLRTRGAMVEPDPEFYIPVAQTPPDAWDWTQRTMTIVAVGNGGNDALVRGIRNGVKRVDASVPVYSIATVGDALRGMAATARFNTMLLASLGILGLTLAGVGIYGVVSYFVNLRGREIGVRMALGATSRSVVTLMIGQALVPVITGLLIGAVAAFGASRLIAASLFNVSTTDPVTFGAVTAGLLTVALLAIVVPARRAARVAPSQALM